MDYGEFLKRVWKLAFDFSELVKEHGTVPALTELTLNASQKTLRRELHKTIAKVSDDIGRRNTSVLPYLDCKVL